MDRALRRHHEQRIKQKIKDYYSGWPKTSPRATGMIATTRQLCSGPCCGNPRKHFKELTKQEKIHDLCFELKSQ